MGAGGSAGCSPGTGCGCANAAAAEAMPSTQNRPTRARRNRDDRETMRIRSGIRQALDKRFEGLARDGAFDGFAVEEEGRGAAHAGGGAGGGVRLDLIKTRVEVHA